MAELLRFATAGSVDDGKSTLIGRLLYDSKAIFEDQLEAVERSSEAMGADYTNLALLTDGLRAEREQGITIDVAYRYFATPKRKFIIADTPGPHPVHAQHGHRSVDRGPRARAGRRPQRSGRAVPPSRVPGVAAAHPAPRAVRQQDGPRRLVRGALRGDQGGVPGVRHEARRHATSRSCRSRRCTATTSSSRSANTPWYEGSSLLHQLEEVHIASDRNLIDARFPVQYVVRPMSDQWHDYRGYAGTVAGGVLKPGDEVMVLPSGFTSTIAVDRHVRRTGRGGVRADVGVDPPHRRHRHLPRRHDLPARTTSRRSARTSTPWCAGWTTRRRWSPGTKLAIKHTTRSARCLVKDLQYRLDVNTLHRDESADVAAS